MSRATQDIPASVGVTNNTTQPVKIGAAGPVIAAGATVTIPLNRFAGGPSARRTYLPVNPGNSTAAIPAPGLNELGETFIPGADNSGSPGPVHIQGDSPREKMFNALATGQRVTSGKRASAPLTVTGATFAANDYDNPTSDRRAEATSVADTVVRVVGSPTAGFPLPIYNYSTANASNAAHPTSPYVSALPQARYIRGVKLTFTPAAPTNLTPTPGATQVALSWTAPANSPTGYVIQYKKNTDTAYTTTTSATTSKTITGLTSATLYNFIVSATFAPQAGGNAITGPGATVNSTPT